MTTPTVPPVTCPIEIDPLAAPCGTGMEGWGGTLAEPVVVCLNGETITATDQGTYQQAVAFGALGACPDAPAAPVATVVQPAGLPATGAAEVVRVSIVGALLLLFGVGFARVAHR
jgi:hypothetical protein